MVVKDKLLQDISYAWDPIWARRGLTQRNSSKHRFCPTQGPWAPRDLLEEVQTLTHEYAKA